MFVYSVKSSKLKLAALLLVIAAAVLALVFLTRGEKTPVKGGNIRVAASNAAERLAFLSQFGWEVSEDPIEVSEVIIPATFDETYEKYNEIQKAQSMDLAAVAGKRLKRWTYEVKNYPGFENKPGVVQANLLIENGVVIGGDVCSLELGGFLQGFDFPAAVPKN
ncbi:MAG: DUF4830 domain-containing protein [Oscillospiraceae bacterium]|jgi:hypothetical protein|nr:DUF4830 domain-containing protein [Oscillospiraceae bacterium]